MVASSQARATTMKAIVHDRYGPPDVLEARGGGAAGAHGRRRPRPGARRVGQPAGLVHRDRNAVDRTADDGPPSAEDAPDRASISPGRWRRSARTCTTCSPVTKSSAGRSGERIVRRVRRAAQNGIARKPANLTFEEAAAVPVAALTALQGLRDHGQLQPGQKVLVNGASGGVGTFAVQIAKALGAEVTAVCSTRNVEQARALGAEHVIDYTREDFTRSGRRYDVILDVAGSKSWSRCRRVLNPQAMLVIVGGQAEADCWGRWVTSPRCGSRRCAAARRPSSSSRTWNKPDMNVLREMVESGRREAGRREALRARRSRRRDPVHRRRTRAGKARHQHLTRLGRLDRAEPEPRSQVVQLGLYGLAHRARELHILVDRVHP